VTVFDYYQANEAGSSQILYAVYPNATARGGSARVPALAPLFDCGISVNCDIDLQLTRQKSIGPSRTFVDMPSSVNTKLKGLSNTTTVDLGNIILKNIFGYRSVDVNVFPDLDGTPLRLAEVNQLTKTKQITDELQLSGKALNGKLNWYLADFISMIDPTA